MMLRLRNSVHQITQSELPFLILNQISNGNLNLVNPQTHLSPFQLFFSSSASSNFQQKSLKITDPVFEFFYSYGFTDTQIKRFIIHRSWSVSSTEIIKLKLKYLLALGLSPSELIRIICYEPNILSASLKERIEPNLKILEATTCSKTLTIKAIKRGPFLLVKNLEKCVIPNVHILRENSIPTDMINFLFTRYPRVLLMDANVIIETVSKLKGLGMSPSTLTFANGMNIMVGLKKETLERKVELYRSLGWSEKDTLSVFSRHPTCLALSDDKIKEKMRFFKEKLQWDSAILAEWPLLLMYSPEGRIIPRCAVLSLLAKRKLWSGKPSLFSVFRMAEKKFEERFVDKYSKEVPQVIDAYQGKIDFVGFESKD